MALRRHWSLALALMRSLSNTSPTTHNDVSSRAHGNGSIGDDDVASATPAAASAAIAAAASAAIAAAATLTSDDTTPSLPPSLAPPLPPPLTATLTPALRRVNLTHVSREHNVVADALATRAVTTQRSFSQYNLTHCHGSNREKPQTQQQPQQQPQQRQQRQPQIQQLHQRRMQQRLQQQQQGLIDKASPSGLDNLINASIRPTTPPIKLPTPPAAAPAAAAIGTASATRRGPGPRASSAPSSGSSSNSSSSSSSVSGSQGVQGLLYLSISTGAIPHYLRDSFSMLALDVCMQGSLQPQTLSYSDLILLQTHLTIT